MLRDVVVLAPPGIAPFELGVVCEVFGIDRSDEGLPTYDFAVVGERAHEPVPTSAGYQLVPAYGLERAASADLVAVPAVATSEFGEPFLEVIRAAHARGAWILSVCSGAFGLADAGLLDGRACTTHWRHAAELAERCPGARVQPDVLYVEDERVITSAGTAAGIDACLHLVRREQGASVALGIARRMVVPPHRDGGQAQYVKHPVRDTCDGSLAPLLEWALDNLAEELSVERLARQANQSPRTLARRFTDEVGSTPHRWVTEQRIAAAQRLLETSDASVEEIAQTVGFGTAAMLRHHFAKRRLTTPRAYRRTFAGHAAAG